MTVPPGPPAWAGTTSGPPAAVVPPVTVMAMTAPMATAAATTGRRRAGAGPRLALARLLLLEPFPSRSPGLLLGGHSWGFHGVLQVILPFCESTAWQRHRERGRHRRKGARERPGARAAERAAYQAMAAAGGPRRDTAHSSTFGGPLTGQSAATAGSTAGHAGGAVSQASRLRTTTVTAVGSRSRQPAQRPHGQDGDSLRRERVAGAAADVRLVCAAGEDTERLPGVSPAEIGAKIGRRGSEHRHCHWDDL